MIEHNKESNCHACFYAEGPTGTEGCRANPRAICYALSGHLKEAKILITALEQISKDDGSVHSGLEDCKCPTCQARQALKEYKDLMNDEEDDQ